MSRVLSLIPLPLLALASCGTTGGSHGAGRPALSSRIAQFSLSDLRPSKVPVVHVRENDLKSLPLGEERAASFQRTAFAARARQRSRSWFFDGPVDFREPSLPSGPVDLDLGLLPPKPN